MKNVLLTIVFLVSLGCKDSKTKDTQTVSISQHNFDWLIGDWQRTNDEEGSKTFETWQKVNDIDYLGMGLTLKGMDTTFMETMHLVNRDSFWHLEIVSKGEAINTVFKVSEYDSLSFTCFNMENEFPTHIQYSNSNDTINALIWGGDMKIPFQFVRR